MQHLFFIFRWIQMAKKIISKGGSNSSSKNPPKSKFPNRGSSISESNLSGMCNNNGTHRAQKNRESGISLTPDTLCGRASPDGVTVYKTKVLYHSRADFRSAGLTSQNGHVTSQNGYGMTSHNGRSSQYYGEQ